MERRLACCFRRERHPCFCSPRSADADVFQFSISAIYWAICDRLETIGRITDASECFNETTTELGGETNMHGEVLQWASGEWSCTAHIVVLLPTQDSFLLDFRQRSIERLERSGDTDLTVQQFDEAIRPHCPSIHPGDKTSSSRKTKQTESCKRALDHANEVLCFSHTSYLCCIILR